MTAKKYNQAEQRAYNEAFDSFEMFILGAPKVLNPYRRGTTCFAAWQEGWAEAQATQRERIAVAKRDANTVGFY